MLQQDEDNSKFLSQEYIKERPMFFFSEEKGFPGSNTGVGGHALLQGIFLTQRSNSHLLH